MGVLRWRLRLDEEIGRYTDKRLQKLDVEVLTALRLGAYQLSFLDRMPERAAVHESVELVKRARKRSAVPFTNAVLRKLASSSADSGINKQNASFDSPAELSRNPHPGWWTDGAEYGFRARAEVCCYDQNARKQRFASRPKWKKIESQRDRSHLGTYWLRRGGFNVAMLRTGAFVEGRVVIQDEPPG
jgi:hypothetical protein